jgi:hypothetical protein
MRAAPSIRRLSVAAVLSLIGSFGFAILANQASSQTVDSFRDDFTSISYSGNSGTMNWSGSWQESGESDGATLGSVRVTASDRCIGGSGNCLRIGSDGGNLSNHGVSRAANLSNAASATLSFRYRRETQGQVQGTVTVQVSGNGGSSWTTLTTISLAGPQKASSATFDISSHMGSSTVVRFRGSGSAVTGYLHIDAVQVTADMVTPVTTTTVVTTTIPGTPTTTTIPGTSTATTLPGTPTTTTTAIAGTPTSTTVASTPTTTIPGSPDSTTAPGTPTSTVTGSSTSTDPTSTTLGTTPTPTSPSPTGNDTALVDSPDDETPIAIQEVGESSATSPSDDDLAPMVIAVETVSANAISLAILALLASGLAFVGIDRSKRETAQTSDTATEPEPPERTG